MKQKNQKKTLLIVVIALVVSIVGVSFAYYMAVLRGENVNKISTNKVNLIYTEQSTPIDTLKILSDNYAPSFADSYSFSIEGTSTGKATTEYAIYLEPDDSNNLNSDLISVSLTRGDGSLIYEYKDFKKGCYNYEYDYMESLDACGPEELISQYYGMPNNNIVEITNTDPLANEYNADQIITTYLYDDGINNTCRKFSFYNDTTTNSRYAYESGVEVDTSKCTYGNKNMQIVSYRPLTGVGSYYEDYILTGVSGSMGVNGIGTDVSPTTIFSDGIILNEGNNFRQTNSYTLKVWISREKLAALGVAEGESIGDNSVKAEIGANATFKFKIGVYAKAVNPS